ncbi:MAG TPA: beta-galactosidase, partial [Methylophilus sp.]
MLKQLSRLLFVGWLLCASVLPALADERWVAVQDVSLTIAPDSILDFSQFSAPDSPIQQRVIANAQGHLSLANAPDKPIKFLVGSLGFGVSLGSLPDHALIDAYIQQYKMHGYNMVRLDFLETMLMQDRQHDFDYNPAQLDRFYYLVAALKKKGIYLILNGLSNDNGGYGNVPSRWIGQKKLLAGVHFDADKQAHWKKLMATMYGSVNPYTGMTTLKDPTVAGIVLANENNLAFTQRNGVSAQLKPAFSAWLTAKYGQQQALKTAWGNELKPTESLVHRSIGFPAPDAWTSKRMADTQQFFFETEQNTAQWMTAYLRSLGYQGLVTAYNLWQAPAAHASRGKLPWVDMHHYFAHPETTRNNEMQVRQDSMLHNSAAYIRELSVAKHIGKPFSVTEHGQVFWNPYRRESSLALPAYAAFHGWDAICQHSGAVDLSYAPTLGRKPIIHPFAVGTDPIARVTETLAALLYLRGDVAAAQHTLGIQFNHDDAFTNSAHLGSTPSDISKLSLVTGVALDWQGNSIKRVPAIKYDGQVSWAHPGLKINQQGSLVSLPVTSNVGVKVDALIKKYVQKVAYQASKLSVMADARWAARLQDLRHAGWLKPANQSNMDTQVFESDTGELVLDATHKRMTV